MRAGRGSYLRPLKRICSIKKEEDNPGDTEECLIVRNNKQPQKVLGHPSRGQEAVVSVMGKSSQVRNESVCFTYA